MDRKDFNRLLSGDSFAIPSVLLFEGDEENMKQSALNALCKKLLPEGMEDLNRSVLENQITFFHRSPPHALWPMHISC